MSDVIGRKKKKRRREKTQHLRPRLPLLLSNAVHTSCAYLEALEKRNESSRAANSEDKERLVNIEKQMSVRLRLDPFLFTECVYVLGKLRFIFLKIDGNADAVNRSVWQCAKKGRNADQR